MYSETIYEGPEAVVVAMDIGTTQSEQLYRSRNESEQVF